MAKKTKIQGEIRKRQAEAEKAARRDLKKKRTHYFCVIGGIIEEQLRARGKALNYEINDEKTTKFAEYVKNQEENGGLMSKALCAIDAPTAQNAKKIKETANKTAQNPNKSH